MDFAAVIWVIVAIVVVFVGAIFLSYLRSSKQRKFFAELHQNLAPGVYIMFCGGMYGTVKSVDVDDIKVEIAPKVCINVSRYAVQQILDEPHKG